jgi:hypothetical protein
VIRGGIFGLSLSGKTTLAKAISYQYWIQKRIPSLVLDPFRTRWGDHAWVTNDEEWFWKEVWQRRDSLVIVDDASATIAADKELVPVFTMLRHNHHRLLIIGHHGNNLLPAMRQEFDTLFLFRQGAGSAEMWAENNADKRIRECTSLNKYEFLEIRSYGGVEKRKLTLGAPVVSPKP